ncbi:hypothetical protein AA313_de0202243 [Arthrobotrys entomopaga]|nr:hypothetical protein AA313_de0202243 [Arthrobotrys entomopaga]
MEGTGRKTSNRLSGSPPYEYEEQDEVVVIKQEAASSQHQADIGLDGNRDRDFDDYGLDIDEEDAIPKDILQSENQGGTQVSVSTSVNTTPDGYATADERPSSPDYLLDDLDDLTEEETLQLSKLVVEPKTVVRNENITANWKTGQKQKIPDHKLRLPEGLTDILTNSNVERERRAPSNHSQPLFYQKENITKKVISATSSGKPCMESRTKKPAPESTPLPRQDRGLSPGPSRVNGPSRSPLLSTSQAPTTPQKPPQPSMLFSSPVSRSPFFSSPQKPRPVNITKLGDLLNKPLGSKVDILAVIARCDEKPITRSIGVKRDMHLLDPTVKHTVWLSVWVDAENFKPAIGTCILFRGLTVHKYDGRSLNAFREVASTHWCIIEPTEDVVTGVDEVKEWWRKREVEEALRSFGEDDDVDFEREFIPSRIDEL